MTAAEPVDFSKRFIPEQLTPLFHTPSYQQLSGQQRLRYNQLHASYFIEQIIFFESAMAQHILRSVKSSSLPGGLPEGIHSFIAEETKHSEMFRQLNRHCMPMVYGNGDFYFISVGRLPSACLRQWVRHARWFPFFLWILLVQEERALFYAREYLNSAEELEPQFVAAQRRHLSDEVGHTQWDEQLLDWIWPRTSPAWRNVNARLFCWMMAEYFTIPKRSGLRVVTELVREFPGLQPRWPEMHGQMLQLSQNQEFNELCYSRIVTPKAFARFDQWPEFRSLGRVLAGYRPGQAAQKLPK